MEQRTLRIGSRDSKLAVIQSELVIRAIEQAHPELRTELITMKTTGDKILDRTLDQVGGKGLFVKELDIALLEGRVDLTVHSCKDLPMEVNPALPLCGFSEREDPRDVLVLPEGADTIDFSKPIGSASPRRTLQLQELYPEAVFKPVRGNVQTRLRKLDSGEYAALVLAAAGLKRLGLEHRISRYFTTEEVVPAAGQGIMALQTRAGEDLSFLDSVISEESALCVTAERAFVTRLGGGCSAPIGAYAEYGEGKLHLRGFVRLADGSSRKGSAVFPAEEAVTGAEALADTLRNGGAL